MTANQTTGQPRFRLIEVVPLVFFLIMLSGSIGWGQLEHVAYSPPSFNHRVLDTEGGHTQIGDINGDGKNDIVVHHQKHLAWFPYPGYQKQMIQEGHFSGDRFALADLDQDGDLDLVSGKGRDDTNYQICWYENPRPAGQETSPWREHLVGSQGQYIKDLMAADMDQNGKVDVVARSHGYTHIFLRQSGGWEPRRINHPFKEGMALADLDRDGDKDIILNGFWLETPANPRRGEFKQHTISEKWFTQKSGSWQDNCASVAVGDINGDGLVDVLLSHSEKVGWPVAWYTVDSSAEARTGPWREHMIADVFDWCETLQVGDINGDGYLDVMAAKFERDHKNPKYMNEPPFPIVTFYNRKGDGSQWTSQEITDTGVYAGILGDVGSDGDLDIVGPRSYWKGPVELWESESSTRTKIPLDQWLYVQVDDTRDKRCFGLAFGDINRDGYQDIAAGKWFYHNPGGDLTGTWERVDIDEQLDALVTVDVDGDEFGDIIGLRPNEQYWCEAADKNGSQWRKMRIGSLPIDDHRLSTQIYGVGQLIPGGKPEIILSNFFLEIPARPQEGDWPATKYSPEGNGYAIGDIDRDGLLDIGGSYRIQGEGLVPGTRNVMWGCSRVCWWKNPGNDAGKWQRFDIGTATHADRFALADLNGDERLDLAITEERYPGHVPNGSCYWFEQPSNLTEPWSRHLVVTQLSMNNLDVGDVDRDGDIDLITCEHTMPYQGKPAPDGIKLEIWENDGRGHFSPRIVDREKESHLGAQLVDLDADGDLDIVSIAWRDFQFLHVWRNDARPPASLGTGISPSHLPPGIKWTLTFADEFEGQELDKTKWIPRYQWGSTHNYNAYCDPNNVLVENGLLRLKVEDKPSHNKKYTSAVVTTYDKFSQQYGYFEGRFKVPSGKGFWPAFWMLPYPQHWPPEIDIFEMIRDDPHVYMTFHWKDGKHRSKGAKWAGENFSYSNEFHTYGVDWSPDKIVWYIDGTERARFTDKQWICREPMYLLVNFGIDAKWPGPCDETTPFPSYYECDWVRVYQSSNAKGSD